MENEKKEFEQMMSALHDPEIIESLATIKTLREAVGYSIELGEVTEGLVDVYKDSEDAIRLLEQERSIGFKGKEKLEEEIEHLYDVIHDLQRDLPYLKKQGQSFQEETIESQDFKLSIKVLGEIVEVKLSKKTPGCKLKDLSEEYPAGTIPEL